MTNNVLVAVCGEHVVYSSSAVDDRGARQGAVVQVEYVHDGLHAKLEYADGAQGDLPAAEQEERGGGAGVGGEPDRLGSGGLLEAAPDQHHPVRGEGGRAGEQEEEVEGGSREADREGEEGQGSGREVKSSELDLL